MLGTTAAYILFFGDSFTFPGDIMQFPFVGDFYGVCMWGVCVSVCLCVPHPSPRPHCAFFRGGGAVAGVPGTQ